MTPQEEQCKVAKLVREVAISKIHLPKGVKFVPINKGDKKMEKKEALRIVEKQINDYDNWSGILLDSLLSRSDLCKHPYPAWSNKHDEPKKCFCLVCGSKLDYDKDVHGSFKAFNRTGKVKEAIQILRDSLT